MNDDIKILKDKYPPYTQIKLSHMLDKSAPPTGTIGIVTDVDDIGTIHMQWQNGSTLGLIEGIDDFEIVRRPYKTKAHINSLGGQTDEITVLQQVGDNDYLVDYKGVKCHAIFNPFVCEYYADDLYTIVKEDRQ